MSSKNLVIEIYFKNKDKKSFLAKNISEATSFLKPLVSNSQVKSIIDSLVEQQKDPNKFPNIVLFIDNKRHITIDEFLKNKL